MKPHWSDISNEGASLTINLSVILQSDRGVTEEQMYGFKVTKVTIVAGPK